MEKNIMKQTSIARKITEFIGKKKIELKLSCTSSSNIELFYNIFLCMA